MKKTIFMTIAALGVTALLLGQNPSQFNGNWKGEEGGQLRQLIFKDGVVFMEEKQPDGRLILRQYPTQGQEITMTEGVWAGSTATGKMEGNKLVVDTTMPTGMKWHDEWTLSADGKSYSALRQMVSAGDGGGFGKGKGGGAPAAKGPAPAKGPGGGKGKAPAGAVPETFVRVN